MHHISFPVSFCAINVVPICKVHVMVDAHYHGSSIDVVSDGEDKNARI